MAILEVKNITKHYGDLEILNDFSLKVEKGDVLAILGPSGCGKSTLLRCINGLERISAGDILLKGESVVKSEKEMPDVRKKIGMVFQSYELFGHMNVLDNLTLGPIKAKGEDKKQAEERARALLERVGLGDKAASYPANLSGGQQQRVAILRAMLMDPDIYLFDEVTAALDPEMVQEVLALVGELAEEGKTMLIVTHEMEFARQVADRILFLEDGAIVEDSDPETFFEHPKTERARQFLEGFHYH
ncbi:glutamate ABC transporter, ATP-binding protein GluA [Aedoeadaptatus coxii]|uniref:amino acid ABC transporter ATP-binding protein n=1 Tax=Aedoeadaptatus coxii TaxID=755172 RepID=UPI001760FEFC|nr:amino acid ABC transporter ATP-binding protein [Peptoniphilus coxii]CAC9932579.1 glutamate ABC transporter, ATP-binding protein GluA [Peptoniphilus coxii]